MYVLGQKKEEDDSEEEAKSQGHHRAQAHADQNIRAPGMPRRQRSGLRQVRVRWRNYRIRITDAGTATLPASICQSPIGIVPVVFT
jgi:hypothetical protein